MMATYLSGWGPVPGLLGAPRNRYLSGVGDHSKVPRMSEGTWSLGCQTRKCAHMFPNCNGHTLTTMWIYNADSTCVHLVYINIYIHTTYYNLHINIQYTYLYVYIHIRVDMVCICNCWLKSLHNESHVTSS